MIAFVNETHNASAGSGASVATASKSHTSGNFVGVGIGWEGSGTLSSVTDTAGNTYTKKTAAVRAGAVTAQIAYAYNITGNASNVVTANFSGTIDFSNVFALQYSGVLTTDPFDKEGTGSGSNTGSVSTAATGTTTQADELLFVMACNFGGGITWAPGTGYTERVEFNNCAVDEQIVSATGSYTGTMTLSGTVDWAMAIATFKAAAGTTKSFVFLNRPQLYTRRRVV